MDYSPAGSCVRISTLYTHVQGWWSEQSLVSLTQYPNTHLIGIILCAMYGPNENHWAYMTSLPCLAEVLIRNKPGYNVYIGYHCPMENRQYW